jgi:hypothetical protein
MRRATKAKGLEVPRDRALMRPRFGGEVPPCRTETRMTQTTTLAGRPALAIRFGRSRELLEVPDLPTASRLYAQARDAALDAGKRLGDATVYEIGAGQPKPVAVISYNARVWEVVRGHERLLHDPLATTGGAR